MTSLRRTAILWMTALLTLVGVVAFGVSYNLARNEAAGYLDSQLRQLALNVGDSHLETADPPVENDPEEDFVIMVWDASGKVLRLSAGGLILPRQTKQGFATMNALGEDWRAYLASDGHRLVQVAQRMSVREEMAETAAIEAGAPILGVIPLAWLVISFALNRVLGQVSNLARTIAERGVDSKEQISVVDVPREVRPLVEAMNILTDRLQRALEQQKRFVADAAHELRTPLAALHLQLDNLRAQAPKDPAGLVAELGDGIRRASALVEQLLRLARAEGSELRPRSEMLDLTELVTQCVADYVFVAAAKGVDLGMGARDSAYLPGCPTDLKMLFGTVIDNAIRYTPGGGMIDVSVVLSGETITVEILDTGCGVADADIPRLFDRFFRAAPIDVDGSGLGLSIADAVARRNGLSIAIENRKDRSGLRVRISPFQKSIDLIRP